MGQSDIDKLFRQNLDDFEIQPASSAFERINSELSKKNKINGSVRLLSILLFIAIGIAAYFLTSSLEPKTNPEKQKLQENQYAQNIKNKEEAPSLTPTSTEINESEEVKTIVAEQNNNVIRAPKKTNTLVNKSVKGETPPEVIEKTDAPIVHEIEFRNTYTQKSYDVHVNEKEKVAEISLPVIKVRLNRPSKINIDMDEIASYAEYKTKSSKPKSLIKIIEKGVESKFEAFITRNYESEEHLAIN